MPQTKTESMTGSLGLPNKGTDRQAMSMSANMAAVAGLESLEVDEKTADEIINNVEKMIKAEKTKDIAIKRDKKSAEKALDLTETSSGIVSAKEASATSSGGASSKKSATAPDKSSEASGDGKASVEGGAAESADKSVLDQNLALIRRKTISVKSDNVSNVVMSNISAITDSVATFQKLEEESNEYDVALQLQNQQENYQKEIAKLKGRIEKQTERRDELKSTVTTMGGEVE